MKKIITVLLVLAIGMMVFTGCVQAGTDDNSKNDSSSKNEITSNSREDSISKNDESKIENISSVNSNSSTESIDSPIEWSEIIITTESLNREKAIEEIKNSYINSYIYIWHDSYEAELEEVFSLKEMQTIVGFDEAAIAITEDKYINTLTVDNKDFLLEKYVDSAGRFYYLYNDILIVPRGILYGKEDNNVWFYYELSVQALSSPYFREARCKEMNCRVMANGDIDTSYVI